MVQNETEYKYLINQLPKFTNYKKYYFNQTYFSKNQETLARIRKIFPQLTLESFEEINTFRIRKVISEQKQYILTLKTKGLLTRKEYEEEITEDDYLFFLRFSEKTIKKYRYVEIVNNYTFEFDKYLNTINDLLTVEVETEITLENQKNIEDILHNYYKLTYQNVTDKKEYKNKYLQTK